ncbi:MAG TPA: c-type cytochrome [Croceicoccus sp.]|nr:c-type cytochrome [Croceicoccus sp.]
MIALSGGDAGPGAACHTCHGLKGEGDGALVPRIAALDAGYLVRQLGFFADGQRSHPQMSWLAGRLDSSERMAVSVYYAGLPMPDAQDAGPSNLREAGQCEMADAAAIYHDGAPERDLVSCASCHGNDGEGMGAGNPALVGQSGAYHAEQLRQWRTGRRYGDAQAVMHEAAGKLREDELIPLAAYIADGPALSRRPRSPARCP